MDVSVVIPAYNEASRIGRVIQEARPYAQEIIVVDDCSSDNTAQVAKRFGANVITHKVNRGHKAAVKTGFKAVQGDIVVTLDADGEYPAWQIPRLVEPIAKGDADVVSGTRERIPRLSEQILTIFTQVRLPVADTGGGFKALRTDLAKDLKLPGRCICGTFLLEAARKGGKIVEVPVKTRTIGKVKQPAWHHLLQFFYVIKELLLLCHTSGDVPKSRKK